MVELKTNTKKIIITLSVLFCIALGFEGMSENSTHDEVDHNNTSLGESSLEDTLYTRGTYSNIKLWDDIGEAAEDRYGMCVTSAGDVDNDGFSDFIVGCENNDAAGMDAGKVYIYRGGQSISQNPFWQKRGEAWNHKFGASVASAGDVNNDGFDDVIVGAPQYRDGDTYKGKVYIYRGGTSMGGAAFWTCVGEAEGDNFGCSVASAGDVNNDGFDDVIVGAKEHDGGGNSRGKAYVFLGGAEMSDTPFWEKTGEQNSDDYGNSVASAGNVNGDEYDDIIIGADNSDEEADGAGKAYIHLGGASISQIPYWEATGELEYENFGKCVAPAGDVNNDGLDDVAIGAPESDEAHDEAGKIYIFLGGIPMNRNPFFEILGESREDEFGAAVASAGNVNGDGFDDIIVGSLFNDAGGKNAGKAYVFLGGATMNGTTFWTRTGERNEDRFGYSAASAGDVNSDGYDDVIIGAIANDAGGNNAGKSYVYAIMTNNRPEVSNLSVEPLETRTTDNLTADYTFIDTDDDTENGTIIRWYRNGILVEPLNDNRIVNSNLTSKGENWSFTVQPGDGLTTGVHLSSPNRTILNSPPVASDLRILPVNPRTAENLIIDYASHDADNDTVSGSYIRWYQNGSLAEEFNDLLFIPASATTRDMRWNATLVPSDGEEFGQLASSSEIIIRNSPPTVSGMFINPLYPRTDDNLTAIWNFSDDDNDNETGTEIMWFRNYMHMEEYDDELVIGPNATEKNEVWHFRVQPCDGIEPGPPQSSPDITILNTHPVCFPASPLNGTIIIFDKVLLSWNASDVDNDSLTYNIFLDNEKANTKIESDLDRAYLEVSDLVNGVYYWRVEAFDGDNTSKKMLVPLSFIVNVTAEDFVPVVRLESPENNSILNDTSTELRWSSIGDLTSYLTYDVYFGTENIPPLVAGNITSLNYSVENLVDRTRYYWAVIPRLGDLEGNCIGGTHTFEVRVGFIPVYDVSLSLEREKITIIKGAVGLVDLNIENLGNVNETINLNISGSLKDRVVFTPIFHLVPNEIETTTIKIITNDRMEPGTHILTIGASYRGGEVETELEVIVADEEEESPDRSSGSAWLLSFIGVVILLTTLVIIILLIRSRRKKRRDDAEEVIADIEHVPTGGIRSEMPTAQIIAHMRETPSMAGSIQHGYIRREPMMRGPMETLPGMQSHEAQLSGPDVYPYDTYPAAYGNPIRVEGAGFIYPEIGEVAALEQPQPTSPAVQFPPDATSGQPRLPEAAGPATAETDAVVQSNGPILQPRPYQESDHGTSEPNVSMPSEEQQDLGVLQQPKLPPARNSEHGTSQPNVSVPIEEQQDLGVLQQPKLPPARNSEDPSGLRE